MKPMLAVFLFLLPFASFADALPLYLAGITSRIREP
jgi:hypothetical protein